MNYGHIDNCGIYEIPWEPLKNSVLKVGLIGSISFIEKPVTREISDKVREIVKNYTPVEFIIVGNELNGNGVPEAHTYFLGVPFNCFNEVEKMLADEKNT